MINFILSLILALSGVVAMYTQPNLLGFICGGVMWFFSGGLTTWQMIRLYRKSLGYKEDPFEPENIYLT